MKQILFAQVDKIRRKDLQFFAADNNKNEAKFKLQDQYARSQLWFDLDLNWIDKNLALVNLVSIKNYFKVMKISKTILRSKHFKSQLEMQNV